jgi:hypothetical protein
MNFEEEECHEFTNDFLKKKNATDKIFLRNEPLMRE